MLTSKIIIELINNYKNFHYNRKEDEELEKIKKKYRIN